MASIVSDLPHRLLHIQDDAVEIDPLLVLGREGCKRGMPIVARQNKLGPPNKNLIRVAVRRTASQLHRSRLRLKELALLSNLGSHDLIEEDETMDSEAVGSQVGLHAAGAIDLQGLLACLAQTPCESRLPHTARPRQHKELVAVLRLIELRQERLGLDKELLLPT